MKGSIPSLIAEKISGVRAHFHEMQAKIDKKKTPPVQVPGLGEVSFGFVTKPLQLSKEESRFWEIADDDELLDFLMGDMLSALYMELGEEEWVSLPPGYSPLVTVLEFERHSQFEGWTAVSNHRIDGMLLIVDSYRSLGLGEEAEAIAAVAETLRRFPDSADASFDRAAWNEAASAAYGSVANSTPEFEDRIPAILAFVRGNPKLFAAA